MENCLVSIIVPVYNVEDYIDRCITSLVNQTYSNIEIIIVNDGSEDKSVKICESYKKRNIKIIHQKNLGLSEARNTGIKNASGKYILFVDSDDYIENNSVEILANAFLNKDIDVVCANAIREEPGKNKKILKNGVVTNQEISGLDYFLLAIKKNTCIGCVWLNMYSTKFLLKNSLFFKAGRLHEDDEWTPRMFIKAKKVMYINFDFYHYIIRKNSITQSEKNDKHIEDMKKNIFELEKYYRTLQLSENTQRILLDCLVRQYLSISTLRNVNIKKLKMNMDKDFIRRNTFTISTKIKVLIFRSSINAYRYLYFLKNY